MSPARALSTYLALLRGVNVGGKNLLPMKDLAGMFAKAGCSDVRTYIQSGNVIFQAPAGVLSGLAGRTAQQIQDRFGLKVPVILRSTEQIQDTLRHNPFLKAGTPENTLHVVFLTDLPNPQDVSKLDPHRSPADAFVVRDREIYLHLPNGVANSKLTNAYFDSKLSTVSTARNWRTVNKLHKLMTQS